MGMKGRRERRERAREGSRKVEGKEVKSVTVRKEGKKKGGRIELRRWWPGKEKEMF